MIANQYITPHPALRPWVNHYVLSTSEGAQDAFTNYWTASHETSLIFFLADKPTHSALLKDANLSGLPHSVIGLQTQPNGAIQFRGHYRTFIIFFTANGFTRLFDIPAQAIRDRMMDAASVLGSSAQRLYDQLLEANSQPQMAHFTDRYLLSFLSRSKTAMSQPDGITHIARLINEPMPGWDVSRWAQQANMSLRNFTRRFTQQTGVSPKFYLRLVRTNQALTSKLLMPQKSWTRIAYECGYFDQAHLINDVRQFAGLAPSQYTDFVQVDSEALQILPATTGIT